MAIGAPTVWRIRAGGNNANGGGFDATISGAGTDYTDQDAAQLTLTDIVTTGTTTVTSATGGFTAAMIGNCLRLVGDNYYFITARASTTSITVDRATGTGSGQTGSIGGAFADPWTNLRSGGALGAPTLSCPLKAGNTIAVRGSGLDNPTSYDYITTGTGDFYTYPDGDTTNGYVHWIGYNGRPMIKVIGDGLFIYNCHYHLSEGFKFQFGGSGSYGTQGLNFGNGHVYKNCHLDANGADAVGFVASRVEGCHFYNTGSTAAGTDTRAAVVGTSYPTTVIGCRITSWRGSGVYSAGFAVVVDDSVIISCGQHGVYVATSAASYASTIRNNTFDGNGGHGVYLSSVTAIMATAVTNNIISNHGGGGKAGIYTTAADAATGDRLIAHSDYNNLYNNTANYTNVSAGAHDLTVDPQYVGGSDYTPTNPALCAAYPASV
jgi:hypothetical protein